MMSWCKTGDHHGIVQHPKKKLYVSLLSIFSRLGNINPGITTSLAHWDVSGSTVTGYHWPYGPALPFKTRNSEAKKMAQQPHFL